MTQMDIRILTLDRPCFQLEIVVFSMRYKALIYVSILLLIFNYTKKKEIISF